MRPLVVVLALVSGCGGGGALADLLADTPCQTPRAPGAQDGDVQGEPRVVELDLDGDGAPDRLVARTQDCDRYQNCRYQVYLMRGPCGHALGTIWAASARAARVDLRPIADVIATTRDRLGEYEEWYRLDKGKMRCSAMRERRLYQGGALDPQASWGAWSTCEEGGGL